jgi:hypothetical protein
MIYNLQWVNGRLRHDFAGMAADTQIVFAENPLRYTAIDKTYLIYNGVQIWSVAETFGGKGMMLLISKGKPHSKNGVLVAKTSKTITKMAKQLKTAQKTRKIHRKMRDSAQIT